MSTVFFGEGMSLDGYIAAEGMVPAPADDPDYKGWRGRWMALPQWLSPQNPPQERLRLGEGDERGRENSIVEETFTRTGVSITGKRIFDLGERVWPAEAPFHTPIFVLTRQVGEPGERPGGTTAHFVNDGIASASRQAHEAAGGKDIRIAGGGHVIAHYFNARLVAEFTMAQALVPFGGGVRLFEGIDRCPSSVTSAYTSARSPPASEPSWLIKTAECGCVTRLALSLG